MYLVVLGFRFWGCGNWKRSWVGVANVLIGNIASDRNSRLKVRCVVSL